MILYYVKGTKSTNPLRTLASFRLHSLVSYHRLLSVQNLYADAKAQTLDSSYLGDAIKLIGWLDQVSAHLGDGTWGTCGIFPSHFHPSAACWFLYCSGLLEASLQQMLQQVASVSELVQASGM